jgi:hypothetical protein
MVRPMQRFRFEGNPLEQIHGWMQEGAGIQGLVPALMALKRLGNALTESSRRLDDALAEIGVGWEGTAGEGAAGSTTVVQQSADETTPVVSGTAESTHDLGGEFVSTRSRMPTPAEAELSGAEHAAARAVPIVGPVLDQALSDRRRDEVTNEARQRMYEWQHSANDSVNRVQPLPPVPQPVVDVTPPKPITTEIVDGPSTTRSAAVTPSVPGPVAPGGPPPTFGGPPPPVPGPGGPPAGPGVPPPGGGPTLPPVGQPGPPPLGQPQVPPGRPAGGGGGIFPLPVGGYGPGGTAEGRRRAFGPGMYSAEEIARARGGTGAGAAPKGGVPADGPDGAGRAAAKGGVPAPGPAAAGAQGAQGARGGAAAGRGGGGSLLQPAVGGGARGEEDTEHTDKYADKSDEHFTEGIQKVAPPVIGG